MSLRSSAAKALPMMCRGWARAPCQSTVGGFRPRASALGRTLSPTRFAGTNATDGVVSGGVDDVNITPDAAADAGVAAGADEDEPTPSDGGDGSADADAGPDTAAESGSEADPPTPAKSLQRPSLKPSEVVSSLDRHIVGQADAKKAVAIALRNRWRRREIAPGDGEGADDLRREITPRNVLMIGPTGCGKTEVARRMARMSDAPFIKVEATKFTEVGYHGRDVDQIIRDLVDVSMIMTRKTKTEELRSTARAAIDDRILDLLVGSNADGRARES